MGALYFAISVDVNRNIKKYREKDRLIHHLPMLFGSNNPVQGSLSQNRFKEGNGRHKDYVAMDAHMPRDTAQCGRSPTRITSFELWFSETGC